MPRQDQPVANGIRTEHPIPGLPFVDDAHIPVGDPVAIEAIGRHAYEGTWGREDQLPEDAWVAFTTDPLRNDLAWVVRYHPVHGRTVTLYRSEDAAGAHTALQGPALLHRAGGYWWDGTTWFRPLQVWDGASEEFISRPVPGATTVSAADCLQGDTDGRPGLVQQVIDVDLSAPILHESWSDHLAEWAHRGQVTRHLAACVVTISAPELVGDQLVDRAGVAALLALPEQTVDAYARSALQDFPSPQAVINARPVWSRAVIREWAERSRYSEGHLRRALAGDERGMPPGLSETCRRLRDLFAEEDADSQGLVAVLLRRVTGARDLERLAWTAAHEVSRVFDLRDLASTLRYAVLQEFATGQARHTSLAPPGEAQEPDFYGIAPPIAKTLGTLIRYDPAVAAYALQEIVGEAERNLCVPRLVTIDSLSTALGLDSGIDDKRLEEYLSAVFSAVAGGRR